MTRALANRSAWQPRGPQARQDARDIELYTLRLALQDALDWIESFAERGVLPRLILTSPRLERLRARAAEVDDMNLHSETPDAPGGRARRGLPEEKPPDPARRPDLA